MNDGPVQDTHTVEYTRQSMKSPRTGAVELVVAQEGLYVVIVGAVAAAQAGTYECTVCPDMAKLRLSRTVYDH
jgi:hypothetical protein